MKIRIPNTHCFYDTMNHQASCNLCCSNCLFRDFGCGASARNTRNRLARMSIIDLLECSIKELIKLL